MAEINDIVRDIAARHLGALGVEAVNTEPTVDSQDKDALRITIVIASARAASESGDALLDTLSEIHRTLSEKGDERFPIIEYATKEELESVDDPES